MKAPVSQRIKMIIDSHAISPEKFANLLKLTKQSIYNYMSGKSVPSMTVAESIFLVYPEINPHWFLTGSGDMWKQEYTGKAEEPISEYQAMKGNNDEYQSALVKLEACQEKVKLLEQSIKDKDEIIGLLKAKK